MAAPKRVLRIRDVHDPLAVPCHSGRRRGDPRKIGDKLASSNVKTKQFASLVRSDRKQLITAATGNGLLIRKGAITQLHRSCRMKQRSAFAYSPEIPPSAVFNLKDKILAVACPNSCLFTHRVLPTLEELVQPGAVAVNLPYRVETLVPRKREPNESAVG